MPESGRPEHKPLRFPSLRQPVESGIFCITVVFTDVQCTAHAYRSSLVWARELNARIRIVIPMVVPYPLELERPRTDPHHRVRKLLEACEAEGLEAQIDVLLCRDAMVCLVETLTPGSLVVIGCRRTWWPLTREKKLHKSLTAHGYATVLMSQPCTGAHYSSRKATVGGIEAAL